MDLTKDIIAPAIVAVFSAVVLAILGWLYAKRTFVYTWVRLVVGWSESSPWAIGAITGVVAAFISSWLFTELLSRPDSIVGLAPYFVAETDGRLTNDYTQKMKYFDDSSKQATIEDSEKYQFCTTTGLYFNSRGYLGPEYECQISRGDNRKWVVTGGAHAACGVTCFKFVHQ